MRFAVSRWQLPGPSPSANLYSWPKFAESPGRKQDAGRQILTSGPACILATFLLAAFPSSSPAPHHASSGTWEAFSCTRHKALCVSLLKRRPLKLRRLFYSSFLFFFSPAPAPPLPTELKTRARKMQDTLFSPPHTQSSKILLNHWEQEDLCAGPPLFVCEFIFPNSSLTKDRAIKESTSTSVGKNCPEKGRRNTVAFPNNSKG